MNDIERVKKWLERETQDLDAVHGTEITGGTVWLIPVAEGYSAITRIDFESADGARFRTIGPCNFWRPLRVVARVLLGGWSDGA